MPKNLIFICADQLRYDALSRNGNKTVSTPNIDAIGARGMTFHRHYTPNQICSPSRASMATGLYPRHHGLWRNGVALDEALLTLWKSARRARYTTHAVGKLHYQPLLAPADRLMPESDAFWENQRAAEWRGPYYGFENVQLVMGEANEVTKSGHYADWLRKNYPQVVRLYEPDALPTSRALDLTDVWKSLVPAELHYNNWIADRAIEVVQMNAKSPFCLFVSFPDPHHPFAPPSPYSDMFDPDLMPSPSVTAGELDLMPSYLQQSDDPSKPAYIEAGHVAREQGFMLRTDGISQHTLARAIAHTYGMVKMLDDAVGRIIEALQAEGQLDETLVVFTSDHGELLGDHGLLRKGPPPYRQLLQVPFFISGPDIMPDSHFHGLTSHIDLFATFASLLDLPPPVTDGQNLTELMRSAKGSVRDCLFAEYHPRRDPWLYNQTIITDAWRCTIYPDKPEWGELFDLNNDPWEHRNVCGGARYEEVFTKLTSVLYQKLPPRNYISNEVLGAY
jgi:arylsulfatase